VAGRGIFADCGWGRRGDGKPAGTTSMRTAAGAEEEEVDGDGGAEARFFSRELGLGEWQPSDRAIEIG
jgi:hypothetical protein